MTRALAIQAGLGLASGIAGAALLRRRPATPEATYALRIAGMMTQNCVAFTAVSRDAEPYEVSVLSNCVTTVDGNIQQFALQALSTRVAVVVDA